MTLAAGTSASPVVNILRNVYGFGFIIFQMGAMVSSPEYRTRPDPALTALDWKIPED